MNEQILFRLRDVLRRSGLTQDHSGPLILLLLVWLRRADIFAGISLHLSPQEIAEKLEGVAKEHPLLDRVFNASGLLRQLNPVDLVQAVDLANKCFGISTGLVPAIETAKLVSLLEMYFACDPSLPRLISLLVRPASGELIYVPWDTSGQISAALADLGARIFIETPSPPVSALLISMLHDRRWQIDQTNPILSRMAAGQPESRYTLAAALMPFGMKIDLEWLESASPTLFPEKTSSAAVLGIRQLLAVTTQRIVVSVQNSVLFSSGAEYSLRQDLLRRGLLRTVIALPAGLLHNTQIAFSVLVIEPQGGANQVRFINADSQRFKTSISRTRTALRNIDELVRMNVGEIDGPETILVPVKVILDNDAQLQVNRYVLPENVARARAFLASAKTVSLDEIATLVRPPLLSTDRDSASTDESSDEATFAFEIGALDLPEFSYITKPGRRVTLDSKVRADAQFLRPNDIVLIVKGSVGKVGIVSANDEAEEARVWTASQSAIVVRVHESARIDPRALFVQLRSPLGQEFLNGIVSGTTIPMIQLKELRRLQVIVPPPELEHQAIDALEGEAISERHIAKLRDEQADYAKNLWQLT